MEEFTEDRNRSPGDDPPVTAVASRRVKRGREREFEEWVSGILAEASKAPGYLGSEVLRPSDSGDDEYRIVFRFDHASNLSGPAAEGDVAGRTLRAVVVAVRFVSTPEEGAIWTATSFRRSTRCSARRSVASPR